MQRIISLALWTHLTILTMGVSFGEIRTDYLIYNCKEKHWECVDKEEFQFCGEKRKSEEIFEGPFHTCAPIGEMASSSACFQRTLFLTSHNYGARFCVKDFWKSKASDEF